MPILRQIAAYFPVALLLTALYGGPILYRMVRPIPASDLKQVETFLRNRQERLVRLGKMLVRGPWRFGRGGPYQIGRSYQVFASDESGALFIHRLCALDDGYSDMPKLQQLSYGVWVDVIQ